jgi:hypothetical protein
MPRAEWTVPGHGERSANGHESYPKVIAMRPDRGVLAAIGSIYLWTRLRDSDQGCCGLLQILDLEAGRERRRYFTAQDTFCEAVASPDSHWLALLRGDVYTHEDWSGLVIVDLDSDELISVPDATCPGNTMCRLAFLPDSSAVIYPWRRGQTQGFRVCHLRGWRLIGEIKDAQAPVVVAPDGRLLAYVAESDGRRVIRVAEWPGLRAVADFPTGAEKLRELILSADGRRLAAVLSHTVGESRWGRWGSTWFKSVVCWDTASGRELIRLDGDHQMSLAADGETLMTYCLQCGRQLGRLVAWNLSTGEIRWDRYLAEIDAASLSGTLPGPLTLIKSHDSPWERLRLWAGRAGVNWPFAPSRRAYTSELVDVRSGRRVADLPFHSGRSFRSPSGLIAAVDDFDLPSADLPARVEIWDIPPRKSLTWFAAGAAFFALPLVVIACRRVRRLREAAA